MDMYELYNAYKTGSTHINVNAFIADQKWEQLKDEVSKLDDLYQILETTDEITEDNPAFEMMCKFTEDLYIAIYNIKSTLYDVEAYEKTGHIRELMKKYYGNSSGSTQGVI